MSVEHQFTFKYYGCVRGSDASDEADKDYGAWSNSDDYNTFRDRKK